MDIMHDNGITSSNPVEDPELPKTEKKKNRYFFAIVIISSIILSSSFGAFFGFMGGSIGQKIVPQKFAQFLSSNDSNSDNVIKQRVIQEDSAVIGVVEKSTPSVVSIIITKDVPRVRNFFGSPFDLFGDSFGQQGNTQDSGGTQKQTVGGGTGFFITEDGMIVTNRHVVSDASADYTVITNDSKEYPAKVLARDPSQDIAVIKIDGNNFPTLNIGDSGSLKIGQTVIAIGNSLGEFSNTVSRGIISGLKRNVTAGSGLGDTEQLSNIIQTDAAINPGNSGGPLLDIDSNVIGINVAMAEGAQNIGFAIPANQMKKVIEQVKSTGKISTPFLGVRYIPIDKTIQDKNNLPYDYGVLIARGSSVTDLAVMPGSPADKVGIVENDVILEVNGTKINDKNSLTSLIAQYNVGQEIILKVWHKGALNDIRVTLEERKN